MIMVFVVIFFFSGQKVFFIVSYIVEFGFWILGEWGSQMCCLSFFQFVCNFYSSKCMVYIVFGREFIGVNYSSEFFYFVIVYSFVILEY